MFGKSISSFLFDPEVWDRMNYSSRSDIRIGLFEPASSSTVSPGGANTELLSFSSTSALPYWAANKQLASFWKCCPLSWYVRGRVWVRERGRVRERRKRILLKSKGIENRRSVERRSTARGVSHRLLNPNPDFSNSCWRKKLLTQREEKTRLLRN